MPIERRKNRASRATSVALQARSSSPLRQHETALLWLIRLGIVAVLLTPLVVTPSTLYPFVVGKALYSRTIIEVVVALWALLVVSKPQFLPPRSWLLGLLAIGLAWSFVAACLGVSLQRSLWSDFQRMTGWVDAVHWLAFVVVVVSTFRDGAGIRSLLNLQLGVGLLVAVFAAVMALSRSLELPLPLPEREVRRVGGLLGNSNFLGAYCIVNTFIALGFLAQSFGGGDTREENGRGHSNTAQPAGIRLALRVFWTLVALTSLWAMATSGSFGAYAGLGIGCFVLALAYVWRARTAAARRFAIVGVGVVLVAGLLGAGTMVRFIVTLPTDEASMGNYRAYREDTPAGSYVSNAQRLSAVQRIEAIETGLEAAFERPLWGWGPENFIVVWGRYVDKRAADLEIHDSAHNKIVEEAATKGMLGLALYVALWAFVFVAVARNLRRGNGETAHRNDDVFLVFAGAALAASFAQSLTLFDSATTTLQQMLLFALVVHLRPSSKPVEPKRPTLWLRLPAALGCVALVAAGLATNRWILGSATTTLRIGEPGRPAAQLERAIDLFEPLAGEPRLLLIRNLANRWQALRISDSAEAKRLLRVAEREGERALAAEPENWLLHHVLAHLYETVSKTEPEYAALATYHRRRGTEMAPLVSHRS